MSSDSGIEYSVVCVDDSDFMRNEDMRPNRLVVQQESINIVCHHILSSRAENRVALLTLSDTQTVQPLTNNEIDVMRKLYAIKFKGEIKLSAAIKTSLLVLKNNGVSDRDLRNSKKRIVVFIGSRVKETDIESKELDELAVKIRKSNVSLDVICFGPEVEPQIETLRQFVNKVGKNSHLVIVPKDSQMNIVLAESPILSDTHKD